jgi:hypothetical protein
MGEMAQTTTRQKTIQKKEKSTSPNLCGLCRGTKFLCGKDRCPVMVRYFSKTKVKPLLDTLHLEGASPPSVFVGRFGYPKITIGPMIPPTMGDTTVIDTPELWLPKTLEEIVDFRSQLVRGKYFVDVNDVENSHKVVQYTRELALSKNSVYAEAWFDKKPYGRISFYDEVQPHGPSAPISALDITNPKYDQRIEKAYYDTDLKAREAILSIYKDGTQVSKIQRAFSVGAFG